MFDILIALFGGIYFLGKYTYEKVTDTKASIKNINFQTQCEMIRLKYNAGYELENKIKEYIFGGEHFEDICNSLANDLKYVFGNEWKSKLNIPNGYSVDYSVLLPCMHEYWIYHLLLAKRGKIDTWALHNGFGIGGIAEKDINIRFAECIEGQLLNAGCKDVKLVLELETIYLGRNRLPNEVCGGKIKLQSLCIYPTHRLWADYVKKA